MKSLLTILCCFLLLPSSVTRASTAHEDIMFPIYQLFDGMRESDGDKVRNAFFPEAVFHRAHAKFKTGGSPEQFAQAVAKATDQIWDEKIWDVEIQVNDKLASVWTQFAFYLDDKLSHCGVNSFQLYQFEDGWKIIYLVDTFQKAPCNVPEDAK
ncbi:MAG: hypothetical protein GJ680_16085 [Alteromonadaceae bacterium]|nr:hypothetical protein [Alteromonadaceae bacterium]